MDFNNLGELEYKYLFETDVIRNALLIYIKVAHILPQCNLSNSDLHCIKKYRKDFKRLCFKLLHKNQVSSVDDYIQTMNALIIINLKIQMIFQKKEYRTFKEVQDLEVLHNQVNKLLNAGSIVQSLISNYKTTIIVISIGIVIITFLTILYFINKQIMAIAIGFLFVVITVVATNPQNILSSFRFEKRKRMIFKRVYPKTTRVNKIYTAIGKILSEIVKKE